MSSRPAITPTTPTAATTATTATAPTAPTADHGPSWPADEGHPRKWLILCVLAAVAFSAGSGHAGWWWLAVFFVIAVYYATGLV